MNLTETGIFPLETWGLCSTALRCDMAFIEPMHRNKPNITYLLTYFNSASAQHFLPGRMSNSAGSRINRCRVSLNTIDGCKLFHCGDILPSCYMQNFLATTAFSTLTARFMDQHGAHLSTPGGPYLGPMNLAIGVVFYYVAPTQPAEAAEGFMRWRRYFHHYWLRKFASSS